MRSLQPSSSAVLHARSVLLVGVAAVAVASGCTSDAQWRADREPTMGEEVAASEASPQGEWDMVVTAPSATLTPLDGGPDGPSDAARGADALLRLHELAPEVATFADRPRRLAGTLSVPELIALWHGGAFDDDAPNAALVADGRVLAVELVGAVATPADATAVFAVRQLPGAGEVGPDLDGSSSLGPVSLFIDAVSVDPEVTDAITQTNVKVVAEAPAIAMGSLYQSIGRSTGVLQQAMQAQDPPQVPEDGLIPLADDPPPGVSTQEWSILTAPEPG
jgi:hypothetical protein